MKDLTKGEVPRELRSKYKNGVNVALNDQRQQEYKEKVEKKIEYF